MSKNIIKPLPDELLPVIPFNYSLLPPGAIQDYVTDVTDRMQCPPDFMATAIVVAIASAIGRSYQIKPKEHDDWKVTPNLWGVILGGPSFLKSPAISTALKPIKSAEKELQLTYNKELVIYQQEMELFDIELKHAKNEAKECVANGKKSDAQKLLSAVNKTRPTPPVQHRLMANDATSEKLGELLKDNPNGILVFRDEFSGFLKITENPSKPNDRSFYLESWNGDGSYTYDRIGRGTIVVESMVISILGTIQPGVYMSYIQKTIKQGSGDDGFAQRFQLSTYPDGIDNWKNIDRKPDEIAQDGYNKLIATLIEKAKLPIHRVLDFSSDAQKIFNTWRNELENHKLKNQDDHPAIISHLAKYRSLMPSIALIMHLIEHAHSDVVPPVSKEAAELACKWCVYLESHARRIYSLATNHELTAATLILNKITAGKINNRFNVRDIQRKCWSGLNDNELIKKGLELLGEHNYIIAYKVSTSPRAAIRFEINPNVLPAKPTKVNH